MTSKWHEVLSKDDDDDDDPIVYIVEAAEHYAIARTKSGQDVLCGEMTLDGHKMIEYYWIHPVANFFPWLGEKEFADLLADVKENGVRVPIVYWEGPGAIRNNVLDGRNRLKAAAISRRLHEVTVRKGIAYKGDNPAAHVVSLNIHRRHLDETQKGLLGMKLLDYAEQQARKRQEAGGIKGGDVNKERLSAPVRSGSQPECQEVEPATKQSHKASQDVAAMVGVSPRTIENVKRVVRSEHKELAEAMQRGEVKAKTAAVVSKLPVEQVKQLVEQGPKAVQAAAKELSKPRPEPTPVAPTQLHTHELSEDARIIEQEIKDYLQDKLCKLSHDDKVEVWRNVSMYVKLHI